MEQNFSKPIFIWIVLFFFSMPFWACVEESKNLNREERIRVDTLVSRATQKLRVELDSICDLKYDKELRLAVDSILQVRLREIEALRN